MPNLPAGGLRRLATAPNPLGMRSLPSDPA